jgi:hypothetical protein
VPRARRAVGTQDDKGLAGHNSRSNCNAEKTTSPIEVIMAHPLKSFADWSLKVVAVRTAEDSDFEFEFPAPGAPSTPSDLSTSLEQPVERCRDILPQIHTWHHEGINE